MSSVLLLSDNTIKKIRKYIDGKVAYIVPGVAGKEDLKLAAKLKVPILGGEPSKSTIFSSKSGSKRIFNIAEIPTPPSA